MCVCSCLLGHFCVFACVHISMFFIFNAIKVSIENRNFCSSIFFFFCRIEGLRVIRQDPHECLFSFLATQNNNVARVTGMLSRLRETYGPIIPTITTTDQPLFGFPSLADLKAKANEEDLRKIGFGYRAKYIVQAAEAIAAKGGEQWLLYRYKILMLRLHTDPLFFVSQIMIASILIFSTLSLFLSFLST